MEFTLPHQRHALREGRHLLQHRGAHIGGGDDGQVLGGAAAAAAKVEAGTKHALEPRGKDTIEGHHRGNKYNSKFEAKYQVK